MQQIRKAQTPVFFLTFKRLATRKQILISTEIHLLQNQKQARGSVY